MTASLMSLSIYLSLRWQIFRIIRTFSNIIHLRTAVREGSAKAQEVIGMVTGAGPGSMPHGGGWHIDVGPGRSEDSCPSFSNLLVFSVLVLFLLF